MTELARWIEREIARGLQGLIALRLPGAPGEDTVALTLDVWLAALAPRAATWHEEPDAERLRSGFRALYGRCDYWPAPRDLLDALPIRAPPVALPPPPLTDEQRARNRERLRQMMQDLTAKMTRTPK